MGTERPMNSDSGPDEAWGALILREGPVGLDRMLNRIPGEWGQCRKVSLDSGSTVGAQGSAPGSCVSGQDAVKGAQ